MTLYEVMYALFEFAFTESILIEYDTLFKFMSVLMTIFLVWFLLLKPLVSIINYMYKGLNK
jgi:hypothetical protein